MFRTEELVKTFGDGPQRVEALKGVTLEVPEGEVFGIVGHSGAGKSTLIRCLNLLERPTSGRVFLDDTELTGLPAGELRRRRQRIGMIFQHFHLLDSRTVLDNVAFPLEIRGIDKARREKRALEILEIVGLVDRAKEHPSRLSGGMKQRVGIARALAGSPRVLLCDEATSALDTRTAHQILALLRDVNEAFGVTVVLITHDMEVVRAACGSAALLADGRIVESGRLTDLSLDPGSALGRLLLPLREAPVGPGGAAPAADRGRRRRGVGGAQPTGPRPRRRRHDPRRVDRADLRPRRRPVPGRHRLRHPREGRRGDGCRGALPLRARRAHGGARMSATLPTIDGSWSEYVPMLWQALGETIYMVVFAALLTFVLGLLIGVTLFVTSPSGIRPSRWVSVPLGLYVNISRSLPFLILLIVLIPITRFIVGTSLGATAAIVPLTFGTAPFFGRLVETALREVEKGKVEAAEAMGATHGEIVRKVLLPEALPALLAGVTLTLVMFVDYSAMAGAIGAGGLGTFAIKYGYQRFNTELMLVTVVILVVIVQTIQLGGDAVVRRVARRR